MMMKKVLPLALLLVFFSCRKMRNVTESDNFIGAWSWISTTQDSTFYEDTLTSSNTQLIQVTANKNIEWRRNDTLFYQGIYQYLFVGTSAATGKKELIMRLPDPQTDFVMHLSDSQDTLWLQQNETNGKIYKYFRNE